MTSTLVAPRTSAAGHSTRQPFPEVPCCPPGSAAPTPRTPPATADRAFEASASLSVDGCYRWTLTRRWGPGPTVAWIMLNPSRADATTDDPTLRRVNGFAQTTGYGRALVVNLYGWRSPSPNVLRQVPDPIGAANDQAILDAAAGAEKAVAAWGTHAHPDRVAAVLQLLAHRTVWCLGLTRGGQPRHPLYVPAHTPLHLYRQSRHDWTDWQPIPDPGSTSSCTNGSVQPAASTRSRPATSRSATSALATIGWGSGCDGRRHRGERPHDCRLR